MITVYTITYNAEVLIRFMIDHYRARFPDCRIVVYDNMSPDSTVQIALANGCEVITLDTNNHMSDRVHMNIKNSCWKEANTDWVLVCDLDELLDINKEQLKKEEIAGTTIIKPEGYNMINMEENLDIAGIKYGVRDANYDKCCLFNKKFILEINYEEGAHECSPVGKATFNKHIYKLLHYTLLNESYTIGRLKMGVARLSPENIRNGQLNYNTSPYEEAREIEDIRRMYREDREQAIKLL